MRTTLVALSTRAALAGLISAALGGLSPAGAQEYFRFPVRDNIKNEIVSYINRETVRVDIAAWYLTQREISVALINRHRAGIPVRVLGDRVSIFEIDPKTRAEFQYLANAGVPIRLRYTPTSFPSIMHWKCGIFVGQEVVEFGSANWTPFELQPASATNFKDETALFTDDLALVNAFKTNFDVFWADTTNFLDWPVAYQRETGTPWTGTVSMTIDRTRREPNNPSPSTMVWSQGTELTTRMTTEINQETTGVDIVLYRLSVPNITNALIGRVNAGVPVRVFVEPTQYRNSQWPEYWLTGTRVDQLWVAGAQIKERVHQGLTHMKVLITSRYAMQGSSNFTKNWQRDHNYFIPSATKTALYQTLRDEFDRMWDDTVNYRNFRPKPPAIPTLAAPANAATGVSQTPKLQWNRAPWAVAYDVYLGTTSSNMTFRARVNAVLTEEPPLTYSWTVPAALSPNAIHHWRVVARTFATDVDPTLVANSARWTFTTAGSGATPVSTPFNGTPAPLPGIVQAENFDNGGQGVAYFDSTAGNSGGGYRTTDNVDIEATTDTGGGYNLGWIAPGEWLNYTVNVTASGQYNIELRAAANAAGGTFHIEMNGTNVSGPLTVPNTGGSQTWTTLTSSNIALSAGQKVLRLVADSPGPTGVTGNINWIRVVASGTTPPPAPPEIVLYANDVAAGNVFGTWSHTADPTAAGGVRLSSANLGESNANAPLASPPNYFEVAFDAQAGVRYRLWLRMSALNADKLNDAVWVQFDRSVNSAGSPIYRIGTTQGLLVNMATCSTCAPAGWGWQNRAYWLADTGEVRFSTSGPATASRPDSRGRRVHRSDCDQSAAVSLGGAGAGDERHDDRAEAVVRPWSPYALPSSAAGR